MPVSEKFTGIFPAFYACYDDSGNISPERVRLLAEHYLALGVRGLYIAGSSGECILHTVAERQLTLETVMEAVGGRMTIIAHVAAPATLDSITLAQHAEALGVDAISMLPGFYYGLNDIVVRKYWTDVLRATSSVPLLIYNIPGTTNGYNLSSALFAEMLSTGRILGVKNSSGSVQDILRFRTVGGDDVAVFNGPDEQYLAGRMMGASGGIGGTYGFMTELFLRLEELILEGQIDKAKKLQQSITQIIYKALTAPSLFAVAKALLGRSGVQIGGVRAPLLPLHNSDEGLVEEIYHAINAELTR